MFIHTVLFWCKPGTPEQVKQDMIRYAREQMPAIKTIRHIWAGKAVPSARDVVDGSYDVGWCVVFDDQAGHDFYQPHEVHEKFVQLFKSHWAKVRVYDYQ